ncbi:conserved oligomeric Golgi complex subunit 8-like [Teleopsis dalmanni]|uniref:conserved oligomeric Golgi complex subunit 8-like n=1 Tax=Teleopsis dalmanni TaxID=139649 RepID=UPI0018CF347D|nr:conserved oligomeric Golgi complex subunit 8-like [Teleopsis dalmanni]
MDLEYERVLKLIFPDGVPENLRDNPELQNYLSKLGTYKVEQLKKEQTRLTEETKNILEETQELAISNYKTFIHTAENSRTIFREFQNAEEQLSAMTEILPEFSEKCEQFLTNSAEIHENRRINTITLKKNSKLLEILELPQLMERCIREGRYEEALELASYVQKMGQNQIHIPIISTIVSSVEALWHTMLVQLIAQLRTDLQLPKCLQIVGYLRRMQAFSSNELKLKFLQARDVWLTASLQAIPVDDAHQHLIKTIELTRINLFNVITQYCAIFPDELETTAIDAEKAAADAAVVSDSNSASTTTPTKLNNALSIMESAGDRLFQAWLHRKVGETIA